MSSPELSVVVVHYRGEDHLRESLDAIGAASRGLAAETILVDNSGGPAVETLLRKYPGVSRVPAGRNAG
ncbi:MAG TPA: hypothetical protein VN971_07070, partial [Thermoanaerobaculia bacterium]|nr:hypothetical protein [Thermoanaerobaculia bacterium]